MMTRPQLRALAEQVFVTYNEDEVFGCQFGMFPNDKTPRLEDPDDARELAVMLMKLAAGGEIYPCG